MSSIGILPGFIIMSSIILINTMIPNELSWSPSGFHHHGFHHTHHYHKNEGYPVSSVGILLGSIIMMSNILINTTGMKDTK